LEARKPLSVEMKEVSRAWNSKPRGVRLGFGGRTK